MRSKFRLFGEGKTDFRGKVGLCLKLDKLTRNRLKVAIAEAGFDKDVAHACRIAFANDDRSALEALEGEFSPALVQVAKGMNNSRYKRRLRITRRIDEYVHGGYCQFLTLTFKDEVFEKTSRETRRRYVARFLRANCCAYVANIDFGNDGVVKKYIDACGEFHESTAREHYHAVVFSGKIDFKEWHKFGAIKSEKIGRYDRDLTKVSKYVAKLSSHAMKIDLGKAPRLIYSRDKQAIKRLFADLF